MSTIKIGFGGGCHWCTEAVFQVLKGVEKVEQGWVASEGDQNYFSEAIIVHFNPNEIHLKVLLEVHLRTHKSTSIHSMRKKYRSAVYSYDSNQKLVIMSIMDELQKDFDEQIITEIISFKAFKASREAIQNYYVKNPKKPFCKRYIDPKLKMLLSKFSKYINTEKVHYLNS